MSSSFGSYEIARTGLFVNERGLNVTGNNISNVNTPGYVRQQAIFKSIQTQNPGGQKDFGLGTDIQQVRQIRQVFLDNIYRQENTKLGYWESRNNTLQEVQTILGDPMGLGLQDSMNKFWDSWQELAKSPDTITARALVKERAEEFTQEVNQIGSKIDNFQNNIDNEIKDRIVEINKITGKIADLNKTIGSYEASGGTANDYRDQRNIQIDKLTKLVDCNTTEMQDGKVTVTLGGCYLVSNDKSTNIYAGESKAGWLFSVPKLENTDIEIPIKGGILKGLLESRGEVQGSKGSFGNGTPNVKAEIVIAVDLSNSNTSYLANVKANIVNMVNELKKRDIDYNLRLVTYGNSQVSNVNFGKNSAALSAAIPETPTSDIDNNFGGVVTSLGDTNFNESANKYAIVFSQDGNGSSADTQNYVDTLKKLGIKTSVVTNEDASVAADFTDWQSIADKTGGKTYDLNSVPSDFMKTIGEDVGLDVNNTITVIQPSNNILSNIKKQLNALLNVMAREVNFLHNSGKTLTSNQGSDFFTAIDSSIPMQMGNIKLNDNLQDLNNIVASESGAAGDSTIALKIARLRNDSVMKDSSGPLNIDDFYQTIIFSVGNTGSEARNVMDNQQKLVQSADAYRQSITGVSMDEEMTNMMKYKFAYDASTKAFNAIDQMMENIITRMGITGG